MMLMLSWQLMSKEEKYQYDFTDLEWVDLEEKVPIRYENWQPFLLSKIWKKEYGMEIDE